MNKLSTLPVVDNAADIVTVSGIYLAKNLFAIHAETISLPLLGGRSARQPGGNTA